MVQHRRVACLYTHSHMHAHAENTHTFNYNCGESVRARSGWGIAPESSSIQDQCVIQKRPRRAWWDEQTWQTNLRTAGHSYDMFAKPSLRQPRWMTAQREEWDPISPNHETCTRVIFLTATWMNKDRMAHDSYVYYKQNLRAAWKRWDLWETVAVGLQNQKKVTSIFQISNRVKYHVLFEFIWT